MEGNARHGGLNGRLPSSRDGRTTLRIDHDIAAIGSRHLGYACRGDEVCTAQAGGEQVFARFDIYISVDTTCALFRSSAGSVLDALAHRPMSPRDLVVSAEPHGGIRGGFHPASCDPLARRPSAVIGATRGVTAIAAAIAHP